MKNTTAPAEAMPTPIARPPRREQGAILIISLIMLVLITMVTLTLIRSASMEEKMAGNARDRSKAFQAAEAAMRLCLNRLGDESYKGVSPTVQTPATAGTAQVWEPTSANWASDDVAWPVPNTDDGVSISAYGLSGQPRCIYEQLGTGTGSYRVTVKALGAQDTTAVILQATYSNE
jgi:type IV pilus assembly protein PilX